MKIYFEDLTVNGSPLVWEVEKNKKRAKCLNYCVRTQRVKQEFEVIKNQILRYEETNKENLKNGNVTFRVNINKGKFYIINPLSLEYTEIDSKRKSIKEFVPPLQIKIEERKVSFNKLLIEPSSESKRKRANSTSSSSSPRPITGSPIPSVSSYLRKASNNSFSSDQTSPRSDNSSLLRSPNSMIYTPTHSSRSLVEESPRTISSYIITPRSISSDTSPLEQITLDALIIEKNSEAWRNTCAFKILHEKSVERMNSLKLPIIHNISSLRHISLCQITLNGHESKIKVFQELVELLEFINSAYTVWFDKNKDHAGQGLLRNYLINAILDAMTIRSRNLGLFSENQIMDQAACHVRAREMLQKLRALLLEEAVQEEDEELNSLIIELHSHFLAQSEDFIDQAKAKLAKVEEAVVNSLIVYFDNKQFNVDTSIDTRGYISFHQILKEQGIKSSKINDLIAKTINSLIDGPTTQNEEVIKYKYIPNLDVKDKDFYIGEEYRIPLENIIKQHLNKSKNEPSFKGSKERKGSDLVRNVISFLTDEEIKKIKSIPEKEPEAMVLHPSCHA